MKILFVVTAFYPEQAVGSIRVTKFAKYLQKAGAKISVISLSPPPWSSRDESLYFHELEEIQWDVVDQSPFFKRIFQKMRVATIGTVPGNVGLSSKNSKLSFKSRIRTTAHFIYTFMKAIDWSFRVRMHAKNYYIEENFDFIFCSYPSLASPLSGIKLKKMGIGKNLIVDFRDPVFTNNASIFNMKYSLQRYIINNSDLRTFVSRGVEMKVMGNKVSPHNLIAPNGYDLKDVENLKSSDMSHNDSNNILRFVYTGSIYSGKRDLRPFFREISKIFETSDHSADQVLFEYAGKEGDVFLSQAKEFNLQDRVLDHGQLSRANSLLLQKNSDICLLATWNTKLEKGTLTGKVFEYFMFKKPVLAIVVGDESESEISKIINLVSAGYCFESAAKHSSENLSKWLLQILDEKKEYGILKNSYNDEVQKFKISEVVSTIKNKMSQLLEKQNRL